MLMLQRLGPLGMAAFRLGQIAEELANIRVGAVLSSLFVKTAGILIGGS